MISSAELQYESAIIAEMKMLTVRKVVQDVLMFVWHKQEVVDTRPPPELSFVPEITAEFLRNLSITVWIDSYKNEFIWKKYFVNNFGRMTITPYLFAEYVYFALDILNTDISNAYESFCATLSLMTHFGLVCWQRGRKEFLNTCVELFSQFFKNHIKNNFEDHGGWWNFNEYLIKNHEDLQICKKLMHDNEPEFELFKMIDEEHAEHTEPYVIGGHPLETITHDRVEYTEAAVDFAESVARQLRQLCNRTFEEILADFAETDRQVEKIYRQTVGEATGGIETDVEQSSLKEDQDVNASVLEKSLLQKTVKASNAKKSPLQKTKALKESDKKKSPLQKNKAANSSNSKKSPLQDRQAVRGKANTSQPSSPGVQRISKKNTPNKTTKKKSNDIALDLDSLTSPNLEPKTRESDPSSKSAKRETAKLKLQTMLDDIPKMLELMKFLCYNPIEP